MVASGIWEHKLPLALAKTGIVILLGRRLEITMVMQIKDKNIQTKRFVILGSNDRYKL